MKKIVLILVLGLDVASAQSVYELSNRDYAIGSAALVLSAAGQYAQSQLQPLTRAQVEQLQPEMNRLDRLAIKNYSEHAAYLSDVLGMACMLAPFSMLTQKQIRNDFSTHAAIYAETMLINAGAVYLFKSLVKRPRPYVFNPDAPLHKKLEKDARMAFYSGHTSMSFASAVLFAKSFNDHYPHSNWKNAVWAGSLLTAGTVGYLRVEAGRHYPTDVLVGALVGGAIGYFIPKIHKSKKKSDNKTPPLPILHLTFTF